MSLKLTNGMIVFCILQEKVQGGYKCSVVGYDNVVGFLDANEFLSWETNPIGFTCECYVYTIDIGKVVLIRRVTSLKYNIVHVHQSSVKRFLKTKDATELKSIICLKEKQINDPEYYCNDPNIVPQYTEEIRYLENVLEQN